MTKKKRSQAADYVGFDIALNRACKMLKSEKDFKIGFLILVGINVGLRFSDLRLLKFEDLQNGSTSLAEKKTGKQRIIQFNENVLSAFENYKVKSKRNTGYLFLTQQNTIYSIQYINRKIKTVFGKSNLSISTHTLRKTFGRRVWDNNGQSDSALVFLSEIFNHSDVATTRRYLGIRQEQIKDIYLNL